MASSAFAILTDTSALKRRMQRLSGAQAVLAHPFADGRGARTAKIMRTGPKGVYRQFVDQTEYRGESSIPWAKTKKFGKRKAPRKTMLRSGTYRASWLGGAGAIERISDKSVELGVDSGLHKQVKIHQGSRESVIVRADASNRSKGGRLKMFWALYFISGLMFSEKRLLQKGFTIHRRRVSVSSAIRSQVTKMLKRELQRKIGRTNLGTGASV